MKNKKSNDTKRKKGATMLCDSPNFFKIQIPIISSIYILTIAMNRANHLFVFCFFSIETDLMSTNEFSSLLLKEK